MTKRLHSTSFASAFGLAGILGIMLPACDDGGGEGMEGVAQDDDSGADDSGDDDSGGDTGGDDSGDADAGDADAGDADAGNDDAATASDGGEAQTGACGFDGKATVTADNYDGTVEYYIKADSGKGADVCRIRVDVESSAAHAGECMFSSTQCLWAHDVSFSNPMVVTDVDGACANSEPAWNQAAIDALNGQSHSWGYVPEAAGHERALLEYNTETKIWDLITQATWDEGSGDLVFNKADGFCSFGG